MPVFFSLQEIEILDVTNQERVPVGVVLDAVHAALLASRGVGKSG